MTAHECRAVLRLVAGSVALALTTFATFLHQLNPAKLSVGILSSFCAAPAASISWNVPLHLSSEEDV